MPAPVAFSVSWFVAQVPLSSSAMKYVPGAAVNGLASASGLATGSVISWGEMSAVLARSTPWASYTPR
ncbi:hypothetical protein EF918_01035 [Streptomyces sp. WAC06614]|nr:hypothetical protein EF918_01035 [Streptomyces sp. WAC06614]